MLDTASYLLKYAFAPATAVEGRIILEIGAFKHLPIIEVLAGTGDDTIELLFVFSLFAIEVEFSLLRKVGIFDFDVPRQERGI